jgi:hypothetical protein
MVNVLVSNDDLSVLGGPETVNVEVDFGSEGDRGSQIFVNTGKPIIGSDGTTALAPDCQLFDLYINILSSDDEYQYVYQLQNVLGTATWVKLFRLVSNIYSKNYSTVTFIDGEASINVPVAEILPSDFVGTATAADFNIQFNIPNQLPLASSLSVGDISDSNGTLVLPITIHAHELIDGTFEPIASEKVVHLFITVV